MSKNNCSWKKYVDLVFELLLLGMVFYYGYEGFFIKKQFIIITSCDNTISEYEATLLESAGFNPRKKFNVTNKYINSYSQIDTIKANWSTELNNINISNKLFK